MIVSRKFSRSFWTLELILKYFNEELQAKEICVLFKSTSSEKDRVKDPNQCKKVTNDSHELVFKKYYRCFPCLKSGHALKTCSVKHICRKCNGKHHISICDKGKNRNSHTPQNEIPNSIVAFVD